MRLSNETPKWPRVGWLVLSVMAVCLGTTALADDRDHRRGHWKSERHYDRSERYEHREHRPQHFYDHHRRAHNHHSRPKHAKHYYRPRSDWHYYHGRYWAPASYRGRYCDDRRHYHGVHYHVAYDDYYEHYYPRYRYYGPHSHGASLIITVPLF